ncbi:MAG: hypothetical protein HYR56_10705 [Acidobacteria bacterium]|nr:hypothetical protein [Acidobacteriota bacterium]MBI3422614.1 hypothetical protein [Acidobacteriota bacterium]
MNTRKSNQLLHPVWLNRLGFKVALLALAFALNAWTVLAQATVEKAESSQQVQERVDELQRATNALKKGEKVEQPKTGRMMGDYSVTSSLEFGYRSTDVKGSRAKFLSDVDIRDGVRLFEYSLDSRSVTGAGPLYDFMHADATGLGGDPQQTFNFRIDKKRLYKFDASVRRLNYYRYLPNFSLNAHNIDTRQQMSDFNLKLFPQRAVRINMGYNRSMAKGFSTITTSYSSDIFPIPGERRWESNDYRLGIDATYRGWDFSAEEMFRAYKWDTSYAWPGGSNPGVVNPNDLSTVTTFTRPEPTDSHASISRASLRGSFAKRVHVVARGMYGQELLRGFLIERLTGTTTTANQRTLIQQYVGNSKAKRPSSSFDAALSLDLTDNLTLNNTFRVSNYTITGEGINSRITQTQTGTGPITTTTTSAFAPCTLAVPTGFFCTRVIDLSSYWNTLDLQYSRGRKLSANIGWRTTHRDVATSDLTGAESDTQNTNTAIGSIRIRPVDRFNLFFDYEKGQADNVFVRVSPMDFQRVRARLSYLATDKLSFTGTVSTTDRTNPTQFVENDSDYRAISFSTLWEPKDKLFVNFGYNYDHLFSTANIYYFIASQARTGKSLFYAKQDFFFLDTRVPLTKYVDLLLVYRYVHDHGAPGNAPVTGPNDIVTSFPLERHNPEARLAIHFNSHATLNVSYRHFSYNERNFFVQDYRSNIVTTGLRLTF